MIPWMLALSLAAAAPGQDPAPTDETAPASATEAAPEAPAPEPVPPVVLQPWEEPVMLRILSDPLGNSDDRTATDLEGVLRAQEPAFLGCWVDALKAGLAPLRFVQLEVRMRPKDGGIAKLKVRSGSGEDSFDTCVTGVVGTAQVSPAPMFPDRLTVALTWAIPPKPDDEEATP